MGASLEALARETPGQRRKRRAKKLALNLFYVLVAYCVIVLGARLLHRRVLYQPPGDDVSPVPEGAELVTAVAKDGVTVNALEFANPNATRTIVHFHGNAETMEANAFLGREMKKRGFAVLLVEYRGYGRSRGTSPDEQGVYADAEAMLDRLQKRGIDADHVVLWGQSLGTGIAAEMALRGRGTRLELVAPFASTEAMAHHIIPVLPASIVMVDRFDTLGKAPRITVPTLVVHGDIDDVIPFEQGELVARTLPNGTFLKVAEGRHDNLYKNTSVLVALAAHAGG